MAVTNPRIYRVSQSGRDPYKDERPMKAVLGGKGAGLYQMAEAGFNVPPVFTITTDVCNHYRKEQENGTLAVEWFKTLMADIKKADTWLCNKMGFQTLVSVRSGAPLSMPGMMDTILNVGLTDDTVGEWAERIGPRAAWDSYRRLIQMLGSTAYGIPHSAFENKLKEIKAGVGVTEDIELAVTDLIDVVNAYKQIFQAAKQMPFPQSREDQMEAAVVAVFNSWMNPRAIEYRKLNHISEDMGTAVNIQAMVFGNMGEDSGTGVMFTRDPSTGADIFMGEFLQDAQGEDVVAGIRTPVPLIKMKKLGGAWPDVYSELLMAAGKLETMYKDMVDIEFTIQQSKLFILQSRVGKRSAKAAFQIAYDLVKDGAIDEKEALRRLTVDQYKMVTRPSIDPSFKTEPAHTGLPACPGVVTGKPVYSAEEAVECKEPCILITHETMPDDIKGMAAAVGVLTQTGGATCHAAVVARAMDKACVVGCSDLDIQELQAHGIERVTIDGATGRVWLTIEVPVVSAADDLSVIRVSEWCYAQTPYAINVPAADFSQYDAVQMLRAIDWWDDHGMLKVVIEDLIGLTDEERKRIILDLRSEKEFMTEADYQLHTAFGEDDATETFQHAIMAELKANAAKLSGLTLHGVPAQFINDAYLKALKGIMVVKQAKKLADLFTGHPVLYSLPDMVDLVGDTDTFNTLLEAMEKHTGKSVVGVPTAVSPEFAIFDRLRRVS